MKADGIALVKASKKLEQCIVPRALCLAADVSPYAKTIFALLSVYRRENPSLNWLAEHVPCSVPTVIKALNGLELRGWIVREQRNKAAKETNAYNLYFNQLPLISRALWVQQLELSEDAIASLVYTTKRGTG